MKVVNIIGAGRIARPVIEFLSNCEGWRLGTVLVRRAGPAAPGEATRDQEVFFGRPCDLIIEAAGPAALQAYGERALAVADTWAISASALADDPLRNALESAARRFGHRLRLLSGAIAGLDGAAAAAADIVSLRVFAARPGVAAEAGQVFTGSLREAARRYPHEVNVAVTAALSGPGLDGTMVELSDPGAGGEHRLGLVAECGFGRVATETTLFPLGPGRIHPVSASIIAALHREARVIWVG